MHLEGMISQRLVIGVDGKRVPAVEGMLSTPYIADLNELGKVDTIKEAMEKAMVRGCQTFDNALYDLWRTGRISEDEALKHADSKNSLGLKLRLESKGRRRKVPIKKELTTGEQAPFQTHRSYRVKAVKVESLNPDSERRINAAIK